jgi:hypothetical protein
MSRSGYSEDIENWDLIRWRGQVSSAIRGKRGQKLLRELGEAMDAMPEKRLIADELESNGEFCALGVVGKARGIDMYGVDPEDYFEVGLLFDIAHQLAQEIVFINDEDCRRWVNGICHIETPEDKWRRVRKWAGDQLIILNENSSAQGSAS